MLGQANNQETHESKTPKPLTKSCNIWWVVDNADMCADTHGPLVDRDKYMLIIAANKNAPITTPG